MSNKPSDKNDERYKALGFESTFDGSSGGIQWSDLIEGLKTNVLRQGLRARKLIMGEYDTKAGNENLAKIPTPPPTNWDASLSRNQRQGTRNLHNQSHRNAAVRPVRRSAPSHDETDPVLTPVGASESFPKTFYSSEASGP